MNFLETIGLLTLIVVGFIGGSLLLVGGFVYFKMRRLKQQMTGAMDRLRRKHQQAPAGQGSGSDIIDGEIIRPDTRQTPMLSIPQRTGPAIDQQTARQELFAISPELSTNVIAFVRRDDTPADLFDAVCGLVPEDEHDALADLLHRQTGSEGPYLAFVNWNQVRPAASRLRPVRFLDQSQCEAWTGAR